MPAISLDATTASETLYRLDAVGAIPLVEPQDDNVEAPLAVGLRFEGMKVMLVSWGNGEAALYDQIAKMTPTEEHFRRLAVYPPQAWLDDDWSDD